MASISDGDELLICKRCFYDHRTDETWERCPHLARDKVWVTWNTVKRRAETTSKSVRPLPSNIPRSVRVFAMCNPAEYVCGGDECPYAHGRAEQLVWNARRNHREPAIIVDNVGYKDHSPLASDVGLHFVSTAVYKELVTEINAAISGGFNNLRLAGPKGIGKTFALLRLRHTFEDTIYYDLAADTQIPTMNRGSIVLLDNAQVFCQGNNRAMCSRLKEVASFTVAVFSPGANLSGIMKQFGKFFTDGKGYQFYLRPFSLEEAETMFKLRGNSELFSAEVYYNCNGIPRYLDAYATMKGRYKMVMFQELEIQFGALLEKSILEKVSKTDVDMCKHVLQLFAGHKGLSYYDLAVNYGIAYCVTHDGLGEWKLASRYYGCFALCHLGTGFPLALERWQQLETTTAVALYGMDCTACRADGETLVIPHSSCMIFQEEIGQLPTNILDNTVSLLILASGHNVIDSIVFDRRGTPYDVFFVQTSMSAYSKKKKMKESLLGKVKDGPVKKSAKPIHDHYTSHIGGRWNKHYVYATTNKERSAKHKDVYYLDLLKFLPG